MFETTYTHTQKKLTYKNTNCEVFTLVQTISTGMPKLCVSVFSPSGNTTASSSPDVVALRGEDGVPSSGSMYSWKAFTTERDKKTFFYYRLH